MSRNIEAKEFFSVRAQQYYDVHYQDINSKTKYPSLYLRHQYTLHMLGDMKDGMALDIGCGSGVMVRDLLDRGFAVNAADISESMLDATRKTCANHPAANKISYSLQDIEAMNLPTETFDVVMCLGVVEYLASDQNAAKEISRVLKKGGIAFVSSQNKASFIRLFEEIFLLVAPNWLKHKVTSMKQHRTHTPWRLDKEMAKAGLVRKDIAYHHFYPVPIPIDRIMPGFCVWAGKKMERLHKSSIGWMLSTGFVTKYQKI